MMNTDMTVSRQWATREPDQRLLDLFELRDRTSHDKLRSAAKVVSSRSIRFQPDPKDQIKGLQVMGSAGVPYVPTNHGFNQICQRAKAPAGYLKTLAAPLVADCLNYSMKFGRDVEDVGLLIRKPDGDRFGELAAATGPNYGRIWNADIADHLIDRFGDGVTGDWKVPGEFGRDVKVTRDNTTIFASDRDMFVFLADEKNRVTIPNRRDGKSGSLARGFAVKNSEVGAATFSVFFWIFDYACCNRILWGVQDFKRIDIRHTSGGPDRYLEEALPAIRAMQHASALPLEATLRAAQEKRVETDLEAFLKARKFTGPEITGTIAAFEKDEGRPLVHNDSASIWDIVTGATAYARQNPFTNERADLEARAGALLDLAV